MNLNLQKPIGFMVLLVFFVSSSTLACEYHRISSILMKTQNCSFDIQNYKLSNDNVQALRNQQLETIRNVNQITQSTMNKLVHQNPAFGSLANTLTSGLRFGSSFPAIRPEDIQLGTGHLNYRKSIQSTADVLERLGHALYEITETNEWKLIGLGQPIASVFFGQRIPRQFWFMYKLNQIIDSTLTRMLREDLRQEFAFNPIAITVLHGFRFGFNLHGIGQFNARKSVQDSIVELKRLANGLSGIATQWEAQLVGQQQSCEHYLQDTLVTPAVEVNPRSSNTTVVVVQNNQTMEARSNSTGSEVQSNQTTAVSTGSEVQSNLTSTVSPTSAVQLNQTSTVSPSLDVQSNQTSTVSQSSAVQSNQTSTVSPSLDVQSNQTSTVSQSSAVQSNQTSTVSPSFSVLSNQTTTVSPVSVAQPNLTTTVSPVSQLVANLTNIAKQVNVTQLLSGVSSHYGLQQNTIQDLATRILSIYNATTF